MQVRWWRHVPAADAYNLKMILHDWNDEECVAILSNVHNTAPRGAHLFIAEHVVPGPETAHYSKLFDLHMLCWGTGKERTEAEYVHLLESAGWKAVGAHYPANQRMGVVEGVCP